MFIGHFGVALAAKKIDTKPSLGTLFLASQFIDLIWPIFLLLGLEQVYLFNAFGSPPPSEEPIAIVGLSQWLLIAWGYWIDKNRGLDI